MIIWEKYCNVSMCIGMYKDNVQNKRGNKEWGIRNGKGYSDKLLSCIMCTVSSVSGKLPIKDGVFKYSSMHVLIPGVSGLLL